MRKSLTHFQPAENGFRFFLGLHRPNWLSQTSAPAFISRRVLRDRKSFPEAQGPWVLDSGGFSELKLNGEWSFSPKRYVRDVRLYQQEIGNLQWVAPMDWMCEANILKKTGMTVVQHQKNTISNFQFLRDRLGDLVVPVLQGWTLDDYLTHIEMYDKLGTRLDEENLVGVGSICRRNADDEIDLILTELACQGLSLHAFGVRSNALARVAHIISSADSMAWSLKAWKSQTKMAHCTHKGNCANCLDYALRWRLQQLTKIRRAI